MKTIKNLQKKIIAGITALGLILSTNTTFAMGNGNNMGGSSPGASSIVLNLPKRVKISGLKDFNFGTLALDNEAGVSITESICVYGNIPAYDVTANSNGTSGFALQGQAAGNSDEIIYSVDWAGTALTEGVAATDLSNHAKKKSNCSHSEDTLIDITLFITNDAILSVRDDSYIDNITFTIAGS